MLEQLRDEFDRAFQGARIEAHSATARHLGVRVGAQGLAFPIRDISGVQKLSDVRRLPGSPSLGLTVMRGRIVTLFGLAGLLGYPAEPVHYGVSCGTEEPVMLACGGVDGILEAPVEQAEGLPVFAGGVVAGRYLLDVRWIVQEISRRNGARGGEANA